LDFETESSQFLSVDKLFAASLRQKKLQAVVKARRRVHPVSRSPDREILNMHRTLVSNWLLGVLFFCYLPVVAYAQDATGRSVGTKRTPITGQVRNTAGKINVDRIVEDALTAALKSLEEVDIEAQVQESLKEIDIEKMVHDALQQSKTAVDSAAIEAEVRNALRDVDTEKIMAEAKAEIEKAKEELRAELKKLKDKESPSNP